MTRAAPLRILLAAALSLGVGLSPSLALAAPRIAVLDFTPAGDDPSLAPLGKGLRSMITTDLAAVSALQVVERARLEELRAELALQASAAVDASTAVELGRLAGASHLLVGSFTVLGERMRLDAQLTSVEDGRVVLAEQVEGEKDAFFELQQGLTARLIAALDVKPEPKERAALRRVHTADWQAFADYSFGLDLFDKEAYDDSLRRLRAAEARDGDFDLARTTLAEYERVVAELRARSEALRVGKAERARLEKDREAQADADLLARLWEVAGAEADADRRVAALYLLAVAYSNTGRNRGKLLELRQREDRFAMERTADALVDRYMVEVQGRWPELPLVVTDRFYRGLPSAERFEADLGEVSARLRRMGEEHPENRRQYLIDDLRYPAEPARRLHLDRGEEVGLLERFLESARRLDAPDYWVEDVQERLVKEYRAVLRLDDSTALLRAKAARTDNEWALKGLAEEIETNGEYQRLLDRARNPPLMREWLLLAQAGGWSRGPVERFGREHFLAARPDEEGLVQLGRFRELKSDGYLLLGDRPLWVLQEPSSLRSGPRTDPLRAAALRYYDDGEKERLAPMAIWGGSPTDEARLRFRLDFDPADDFRPHGARAAEGGAEPPPLTPGRPTVSLLFGVVDVDVDKRKDPGTGEVALPRPTKLHALRVEPDALVLVSGVETARGSYGRKEGFAWTELGRAPRAGGKARSEVVVTLEGSALRVRIDGREHRFTAPDAEPGFLGFAWSGPGYVELVPLRGD